MPRYVAFLRGINVGGRRVKSDDLRACLEAIGLENVAVFRASGNVIFDAAREPEAKLSKRLEECLERALGYDVAVMLRTAAKVRAMAAHQPFPEKVVQASKGKLQVALLARKPSASARKDMLGLASEDDRLAVQGSEVYWLPSGGISDSELEMKTFDKLLGVNTMRTKGTVEAIAAKYLS